MGETDVAAAPATPVTAKKSKSPKKPRKPKAASSHPKVAEMVNTAIDDLQGEKGGISLQAIKKYITANYKVDMNRQAIFVRRYLKSAVASGSLTQTKGTGASGTFRKSAPKASASKTARQQAIAAKPKKAASSGAKKGPKKSKALAKKAVVKKIKATKTSVKKAPKPKKAKSSAKKAKK